MDKTYSVVINNDEDVNLRLRLFLLGVFPGLETNNSVKKVLKKHCIYVNGRLEHSGYITKLNDVIEYKVQNVLKNKIYPHVQVEYEDEDLMIVYKPPGIVSNGRAKDSMQARLEQFRLEYEEKQIHYPLLIHRLDTPTQGLMIAAKSKNIRRALADSIAHNEIDKFYIALVEGAAVIQDIDHTIDGKPAKTSIIDVFLTTTKDPTSLVLVQLHSGRKHQIRRHLSIMGYPIVGDNVYNKDGLSLRKGLFLASIGLEFEHPNRDQPIKLFVDFPAKFRKYVQS